VSRVEGDEMDGEVRPSNKNEIPPFVSFILFLF